jgi:hypothetical protein
MKEFVRPEMMFNKDYKYVSLDIEKSYSPDICINIL